MLNYLSNLISLTFFLSICLCQVKDDFIIDEQSMIVNEFESNHGTGWIFKWNLNNTPHRIFGKSIPQNFNVIDPIESENAARIFISNNFELFNLFEGNLDLWVNEQQGNLRYLIFNQVHGIYYIP